MRALVQGYTSKADTEQLIGSTPVKRRIRGYDVWFFEFRVHNPFEENPFSRHKPLGKEASNRTPRFESSDLRNAGFSRIFAARL